MRDTLPSPLSGDSYDLALPLNREHRNLANEQPDRDTDRDLYHPEPQRERAQIRRFCRRVRRIRREEATF